MKAYLLAVLACTLVCSAIVAAADLGTGDRHQRTLLLRGPYVALGDSYTAGPDIPEQTGLPPGCDRSDENYPALVAARLELTGSDFRDMSCSGATISDLTGPQSTGNGVNPAQLSALSSTTMLVTLGIGGNDIGFSSLITRCVEAGLVYYAIGDKLFDSGDAPCRQEYTADGTDEVQQRIRTAGTALSEALDEIERRAPRAQVYVVGYPAILPSGGTGCARTMGLAPGDVSYLQQTEQELDAMLQQQAKAAGAGYVDTYTPSTGHDACSAEDTRWIEPLLPQSAAASVHPNERGERGMADAVLGALAVQ